MTARVGRQIRLDSYGRLPVACVDPAWLRDLRGHSAIRFRRKLDIRRQLTHVEMSGADRLQFETRFVRHHSPELSLIHRDFQRLKDRRKRIGPGKRLQRRRFERNESARNCGVGFRSRQIGHLTRKEQFRDLISRLSGIETAQIAHHRDAEFLIGKPNHIAAESCIATAVRNHFDAPIRVQFQTQSVRDLRAVG